ncbi:hypothetical protein vfu_A03067 [Vibrio furnissii NCTC 11218]|nr:hypothetical protein vfu_A03067 [Vibrio furnissii NCTC 11218]
MPLKPASNAWIVTQHPPRESSIIFARDHTTMCTPHSPSHLSVIFLGISTLFYLLSTTESRFIIRSNLLRCVFEACLHDIF